MLNVWKFAVLLALFQAIPVYGQQVDDQQTLFSDQIPQTSTATLAWELGTKVTINVPGQITAVRFWKLADDTGIHVGKIWIAGVKLAEVTFVNETASGWQQQNLTTPLPVEANAQIVVSVNNPSGAHYAVTPGLFGFTRGDLVGVSGNYNPSGFPISSTPTAYFRDIVFVPTVPATITIAPDPALPGSFIATLNGFVPGLYTLSLTLQNPAGTVTTSVPIMMPLQK